MSQNDKSMVFNGNSDPLVTDLDYLSKQCQDTCIFSFVSTVWMYEMMGVVSCSRHFYTGDQMVIRSICICF
mgnify:CR=1 FL=1